MTRDEERRECLYQTTMSLVRRLLCDGVISEEEYCGFDTKMQEKYAPVFGTLLSDIKAKKLDLIRVVREHSV